MNQTNVNRTNATYNLSGRMRKPTYLDKLFPEDNFSNCLVFRNEAAIAMLKDEYGYNATAFGLRFDTLSVHVVVESKEEGLEQFTYDFDELDSELRRQGAIPGLLTRRNVLDVLLDRIYEGCDACMEGETFNTIGETLVECILRG